MKNLSSKKPHFSKNINTLKNQEDRDINEKMIDHILRKKIHENPSKGLEFRTLMSLQAKKSGLQVRQREATPNVSLLERRREKLNKKEHKLLDQTRNSAMAF